MNFRFSRMRSLSAKLLSLSSLWLLVAMVSIGYTLLLSWKLDGGAAAINDAGSLRMRSYHIGYLISSRASPERITREMDGFEDTLARLRRGDPTRPLFLPNNQEVYAQAQRIVDNWQRRVRPALSQAIHQPPDTPKPYLDAFVEDINRLVSLIEQDNARNTTLLRLFQVVLLALALTGTVTMIYLMYLLVINPLTDLGRAMQRLRDGDWQTRIEVETQDEFGMLARGFNQMASRLEDLYATLEDKVEEKTRSVESKNRQLATLYQVTAFLHEPHSREAMCQGFLQRLIELFAADGGSVRLADRQRGRLDLVAQVGLPQSLQESEPCTHIQGCECGQALALPEPLLRHVPQGGLLPLKPCGAAGFQDVALFHIRYNQQEIGLFSLFFRQAARLSPQDQYLIETLGQHLGVAIENLRLAARDRQFAVSEERNLMAQGLHDSIAQSLSFLNLQVQMLESALAAGETEQVKENLDFIRTGVQECYEDVRELLLNFRTQISKESFPDALHSLLRRFEQQTRVHTSLTMTGSGLPLDPQQELQVLFILQEALSNVRKHARARQVDIQLCNQADFTLTIRDDGVGFNPASVAEKKDQHVGLSIMEERARRIHGQIHIHTQENSGTTLELLLPKEERIAP